MKTKATTATLSVAEVVRLYELIYKLIENPDRELTEKEEETTRTLAYRKAREQTVDYILRPKKEKNNGKE